MKKLKLKKKYLIILVVTITLILGLTIGLLYQNGQTKKEKKRVKELEEISLNIIQYNRETGEEIINKEITDIEEKDKVRTYINKIKHPGKYETIGTDLNNEILIDYNDITIGIQIGEKEICYYQDENKNYYAYLSEELYNWAIKVLNIKEQA